MRATVCGSRSQITPLTMTLVFTPRFSAMSISRWMPRLRPKLAHECALVSKKPGLRTLPMGPMPGACPADQAS